MGSQWLVTAAPVTEIYGPAFGARLPRSGIDLISAAVTFKVLSYWFRLLLEALASILQLNFGGPPHQPHFQVHHEARARGEKQNDLLAFNPFLISYMLWKIVQYINLYIYIFNPRPKTACDQEHYYILNTQDFQASGFDLILNACKYLQHIRSTFFFTFPGITAKTGSGLRNHFRR